MHELAPDPVSLPERRSPEFWQALVELGGNPETIARHMPEFSEREIAEKMAEARGELAEEERSTDEPAVAAARGRRQTLTLLERPEGVGIRSNWRARIHGG